MKNLMTKRTLAGMLAILCAASASAANLTALTASADDVTEIIFDDPDELVTEDGFKYRELDDGTIEVYAHNDKDAESLVIPSEIDGKPVTAIGDSLNQGGFLGDHDRLTSIVIPEGVKIIREGAFYLCKSLKTVSIPSTVNTIEGAAFFFCPSLESFEVDENNETFCTYDGVLYNKTTKTLMYCPETKETVDILPDTEIIADDAFLLCKNLTEVRLPDSVKSIGRGAFAYCDNLIGINIPDGVTEIKPFTFQKCKSLCSIYIKENVKKIDSYAFSDCENMSDVVILDGVTEFGDHAFYRCTAVDYFIIPKTVQKIGEWAFQNCTALSVIELPDGLTEISYSTFKNCTALTTITIPKSVKIIKDEAFSGCTSLTDVYYSGSASDYVIGNDNEPFLNADIHYAERESIKVSFEKGDGNATLKWEDAAGAEKYAVLVNVGGKWKQYAAFEPNDTGVGEESYYCLLENLTPGKKYKVKVIAMYNGKWDVNFDDYIEVSAKSLSYPVVKAQTNDNQFRLKWTAVDDAEEYGIAVKTKSGWKVIGRTRGTDYISPGGKTPYGSYYVAVCPKVNGKWDTSNIKKSAVKITIYEPMVG